MRLSVFALALGCALASFHPSSTERYPQSDGFLAACPDLDVDGALCGTYQVWEDRTTKAGRQIGLNVVVLPARDPLPQRGAWVPLSGGPGAAATTNAAGLANSWQREHHDALLVDQRGTGRSNPLNCDLSREDDTAQAYLDAPFSRLAEFERCAEQLGKHADLRLYTTPIAMDDLDEIRAALGYEQVNLSGGSYGSRAALVYLRRHPETVRTAVINGIAPIAFTNPLYHSSEAQKALELTLNECADTPTCDRAFPDLTRKFNELLRRLEEPVAVEITDPDTDHPAKVMLDRPGFAESLRVFMYYMPRARRVPLLIHRAWAGDYRPFAEAGISSNRGIRAILSIGMLLSVTCAEDVARIDPDRVDLLTADTFLGDQRVRTQTAVCAIWPRGDVPVDYAEPVRADRPVLVLSGTHDPVTGPDWGKEAARNLPNSLHLIAPAAHGVGGPCPRSIIQDFLETGTLEGLDTSCVASMELPPFVTQ